MDEMAGQLVTELELESARRREVLGAARHSEGPAAPRHAAGERSDGSAARRSLADLTRALLGWPTQRA